MSIQSKTRIAACGCGQLSAETHGEPTDIYLCSCKDCQRMSGSSYSYQALFPVDQVTLKGERKVWRHYGDSGRWLDNVFCPNCGNTVFSFGETVPDIGICVGAFADPDFPKPKRVYWTSRRHHWLDLPEDVELLDTQPGR